MAKKSFNLPKAGTGPGFGVKPPTKAVTPIKVSPPVKQPPIKMNPADVVKPPTRFNKPAPSVKDIKFVPGVTAKKMRNQFGKK